ncbi:MAG: hypothetical protein D6800_08775 [Candidatus Zixiibacteriota bacterium]|nr:MAG: hypothetical protein D6800_08775 [candidate division Zixibacteria bacterium]
MLDNRYQRGFSNERLSSTIEPKVRKDERGFFIMSLSENTKVYFEDYYTFLEQVYYRASMERQALNEKIDRTPKHQDETLAYYRARAVIVDLVLRTVIRFYTDGANLGVIMSPWCFGTVVLEKIEVYRDRIAKGEVHDPNIPEYPYFVVRYIDEIYKTVLMELFDFPQEAFQMRWQYSELLKRYSKILSNITSQLQSVLSSVKNLGT